MLGSLMLYSLRLFTFAVIGGSVWLLGLMLFTRMIPLAPLDTIMVTDGITIFTGGKTRINVALDLFKKQKSRFLLISGVNRESSLHEKISHMSNRSYITLGYNALDTLGNAEETAAWASMHKIKSLRLITSNYHMPRSLFELRYLLPLVEIIPHPVVGKNFIKTKWWLDFSTLYSVVQEYNKFLFALIRRPLKDLQKLFMAQA